MEVIIATRRLAPAYHNLRSCDLAPGGKRYRIDRGMNSVLNTTYIPFNHFKYLERRITQDPARVTRVFEGGCGLAKALEDLKTGITFRSDLVRNRDSDPPAVVKWLQLLDGQKLPGLNGKIWTAGITLTQDHIGHILSNDPKYHPDKIVIGTLEHYAASTRDRYDFIFDSYGPAYHTPLEAATAYGQLLDEGGLGVMRVIDGFPEDLDTIVGLMGLSGLAILEQGLSPHHLASPHVELLFKKK